LISVHQNLHLSSTLLPPSSGQYSAKLNSPQT